MAEIVAFAKHLGYKVGGAEESMHELLLTKHKANIKLVSFQNIDCHFLKKELPSNWEVVYFGNKFSFKYFSYFEYVFNRRKLRSFFQNLDKNSSLYTHGLYAPIAINAFKGKSKLFLRCENDLAINPNYYSGFKWLLKMIYKVSEYPAFYLFKKDLNIAINKSEVISNSNFMKKKLKQLFGKDSNVVYPLINEKVLIESFNKISGQTFQKGIVFVGDSIIKGTEIAKKIAQLLPDQNFYFFSRYVKNQTKEGNIFWFPWQKNIIQVFKYAKIVIVPSICEEAYGRVSREAYLLNIPVIVSNRGGLPETVGNKVNFIVEDYMNPVAWKRKIESLI